MYENLERCLLAAGGSLEIESDGGEFDVIFMIWNGKRSVPFTHVCRPRLKDALGWLDNQLKGVQPEDILKFVKGEKE